jgi:hypothetical protein
MAIIRAPLKVDAAGKCSRWRVILYPASTRCDDDSAGVGDQTVSKSSHVTNQHELTPTNSST